VIEVTDRALDEVAVAIDQRRCGASERALADLVPQAREIIEVALDLGLGALEAGGADDAAPWWWAASGPS
jgi:predicted transcriptional regulator